ncbi:hypothetical protein [Sodaliphilus sp.]|uniref:hypothetical protein n=1 Tax=Sodaliphilus sp. TaxID=2815818 RepID=UPI0038908D79
MKKIIYTALMAAIAWGATSCKEDYSVGEKVGTVMEFTKKGVIWESWEGSLFLTQTGMGNSGDPFYFSFDNDNHDQDSLVNIIHQAQIEGWKVKLKYHAVWGGKNVCSNRGETDYFVDDVIVLDKDFAHSSRQDEVEGHGRVVDTVYVVLDKSQIKK